MNVAAMHNEPDLAKMSASALPPEQGPRKADAEAEVDYLSREIADSQAALLRTSEELRDNLCASADLAKWVRRYPWAALGVATVAGFTVASVVTPKRGQSLSDKLSSLGNNRSQSSGPADPASLSQATSASAGPRMPASLVDSLFGLARILIETLVMAAVREFERQSNVDKPVAADGTQVVDRPTPGDSPSQ